MIRLQRTGRKHEPTFRVVLTDSRKSTKSGKYLENLGWYDSRLKNKIEQLETEKIKYWLSQGAQLSVTLHNFLVSNKVIEGKKINALPRKTPIKKEAKTEAEPVKEPIAPESAPEVEPAPSSEAPVAKEEVAIAA